MDKDQVIAVLKKNILSILAGVAALLAIGFLFFWVNPQIAQVKQQVLTRANKANDINGLLTKDRPNIVFTDAEPATLGMFPTSLAIQSGRQTMDDVKAQANTVLEQAVEANRRLPLGVTDRTQADQLWPLEGEQKAVERDRFRQEYIRYINADNSRFDPESGDYGEGTLQAMLQATRPPTVQELQTREAGLEAKLKAEVATDAAGNPANPEEFARRLAQERVQDASSLKYRRAQGHRIYIDPNAAPGTRGGFTVHPLATTEKPTDVDCFNAQVGLWVQETVAFNLKAANDAVLAELPTERQNLLHAPVKHILSISVPLTPFGAAKAAAPAAAAENADAAAGAAAQDEGGAARRGGSRTPVAPEPPAGGAAETPPPEQAGVELPHDPATQIERQFPTSPSGWPLHTAFYDMVRFRVTLRCEAESVPYVLEQLQAGSFLSVLNVDMTAVDPALAAQQGQGYVYGDRPVVQLDLQCELPFMRAWLKDLMPASLRQALAETPTATAAAG